MRASRVSRLFTLLAFSAFFLSFPAPAPAQSNESPAKRAGRAAGTLYLNESSAVTPGDVNNDGSINSQDAELIVDHLLERTTLVGNALLRADADGDGEVRMADAVFVNSHMAGLEITFMLPGDVPLVLVRIPAGSFQMGSPDGERSRNPYEGPVYTVDIGHDFYMGKYEVTQAQWLALMGSWPGTAPSSSYGLGENRPAYNISYDDIAGSGGFIEQLNQYIASTDQGPARFRLPSEAEWEYSCRAGTQTRFFFGDSLSVDDAYADGPAGTLPGNRLDYMWFGGYGTVLGSKKVGTNLPNQFGLYDTSGNIAEWCEDFWHWDYVGMPTDGSPWTIIPGPVSMVIRGSSWSYSAGSCRSASRNLRAPALRGPTIGFRLLRVLNDSSDSISIDVTPDSGRWTLTGPLGFLETGTGDRTGDSAIINVYPGDYTLACNDNVADYNQPAPETKAILWGGAIAFAPSYTPESGKELTVTLPGDVPLELIRIPAGSFLMGSPDTERMRSLNEGSTHTVTIANDFYMGKYEITQAQWLALMGNWPGYPPTAYNGLGDNFPAYHVSWNHIAGSGGFVEKLNQHIVSTGQGPATYRLPSEAEWEYACRAGTQTRFFFGDSLDVDDFDTDGPAGMLPGNRSDYMWFGAEDFTPGCKAVGTKRPNQFGLYDMSGNLSEWCEDWYHNSYSGAPANGSAWVTPTSSYRILRGGHKESAAANCRSASRSYEYPSIGIHWIGFRLARSQN